MKFILVTLISLFLCTINSAHSYAPPSYDFRGNGEPLPWPWGTECPFPWNNIEGLWKAQTPEKRNTPSVESYYEFRIINKWNSGTRVFEVKKYSETGILLGEGKGYAPQGQKIVRAIVLGVDGMDIPNHRVIVRAYREVSASACGENLVTVLTARPMSDNEDEEIHYILLKDDSKEI